MVVKLGIDGYVDAAVIEPDNCCPPPVCSISEQSLRCNFVNLLPSGPMWDSIKCQFLEGRRDATSMASVASFMASILFDTIQNSLWPSIRESNPGTAVDTLDQWLEKYQWRDCYGLCRNRQLTILSPFEVMGVCGPIDCRPEIPGDFQIAWDHAILQSLIRFSLRPLATLASLNAILEPLGVHATPEYPTDETICPCDVQQRCLTLSMFKETLYLPQKSCGSVAQEIPAYIDLGCDRPAGMQQFIWPTVMSAECITRAFMPSKTLCIRRIECEEVTPV